LVCKRKKKIKGRRNFGQPKRGAPKTIKGDSEKGFIVKVKLTRPQGSLGTTGFPDLGEKQQGDGQTQAKLSGEAALQSPRLE